MCVKKKLYNQWIIFHEMILTRIVQDFYLSYLLEMRLKLSNHQVQYFFHQQFIKKRDRTVTIT